MRVFKYWFENVNGEYVLIIATTLDVARALAEVRYPNDTLQFVGKSLCK